MADTISKHFSEIKSEQMAVDLNIIFCYQLNVREVLYDKVDSVRQKMYKHGLRENEIEQLQAFRKRERAKLRKKGEFMSLHDGIIRLQVEKEELLEKVNELKQEIKAFQEMESLSFLENIMEPISDY